MFLSLLCRRSPRHVLSRAFRLQKHHPHQLFRIRRLHSAWSYASSPDNPFPVKSFLICPSISAPVFLSFSGTSIFCQHIRLLFSLHVRTIFLHFLGCFSHFPYPSICLFHLFNFVSPQILLEVPNISATSNFFHIRSTETFDVIR